MHFYQEPFTRRTPAVTNLTLFHRYDIFCRINQYPL